MNRCKRKERIARAQKQQKEGNLEEQAESDDEKDTVEFKT